MEGMSYRADYIGVVQGNVLSPLLANLYLHTFDQTIINQGYRLIRYADNLLIMEQNQEKIGRALTDTFYALDKIKLQLNQNKTKVVNIKEGIIFLGYYLDKDGKQASSKAIEVINKKLSNLAGAHQQTPLPKKVDLYQQTIRGWMNYFKNCRGIAVNDAARYLAILELSLEIGDESYALQLLKNRAKYSSGSIEFSLRLGKLMARLNKPDQALNEFSKVLSQNPDYQPAAMEVQQIESLDANYQKKVERLKKIIHCTPNLPEAYQDLSMCYADAGEFGLAQEAYNKFLELKERRKDKSPAKDRDQEAVQIIPPPSPSISTSISGRAKEKLGDLPQITPLPYTSEDILLFSSLFKGRKGAFAEQQQFPNR